jgi:hypothetical protein
MRNNETGEFELLVGNRQLLSGFFIVVLLFAVAFSMGYIVGRNSSPSAKLQTETGSSAGAASQTPETRPQPVSQAPAGSHGRGPTPGCPWARRDPARRHSSATFHAARAGRASRAARRCRANRVPRRPPQAPPPKPRPDRIGRFSRRPARPPPTPCVRP